MSSFPCAKCGLLSVTLLPSGLCPTCHAASSQTSVAELDRPTTAGAITVTFGAVTDTATRSFSAEPRTTPTQPGQGYELGDLIGEGGMGRVFRAIQLSTGQVVAVKKIRADKLNPTLFELFVVEARSLAKLNHPNVVRVYDFNPDPRDPQLVMELVKGEPLSECLKRPLDPKTVAKWIADAARGVHAAHAERVTHYDLKPQNILLTADGVIKVADFGLAQQLDDAGNSAEDELLGGTPGFMSPEQVPGHAAPEQEAGGIGSGVRTDVWGLGATLYAVLTGKPPFPPGKKNADRVLIDPLVPPRERNAAVPRVLNSIVCKCLEKDPAKRYATAAKVAEELDKFCQDLSTEVDPLTWWEEVRGRAKRTQKATIAAWAMAAVLVAVLGSGIPIALARRTPVDLLAQKQADLREGREAVLVEDGKFLLEPKWLLGDAVLTQPSDSEPFASFASSEKVMLAVIQDPGIDRYRITARLRQLPATPDVESALTNGQGTVGVFMGYREVRFDDGLKAKAHMALGFNDRQPDPAKPRKTHLAYFDVGQVESPLFQPVLADSMGPNARLDFVPALPGPWRTLVVDVSPGEITLHLPTGTQTLRPQELAGRCLSLEARLREVCGGRQLGTQEWSPRSSVGVFVDRTRVAVERFALTPLPLASQ